MGVHREVMMQKPCILSKPVNGTRRVNTVTLSSNWSGYAIPGKKGAFTRIQGSWTVPFVRPTSRDTYSSAWIGIDGFRNTSLIQTGTAHDFVHGKPEYYAWWEILPAAETRIPKPVRPGDQMAAVIVKRSSQKWLITLRNLTQNWVFQTLQRYAGPGSSAEWIVEAPSINNITTDLAKFSPVTFRNCRVNKKNPRFKPAQAVVMVQNNRIVSVPSRPLGAGDAFVVRRTSIPVR
ncbi:hypothetical protein HII30_06460 [Paenibacillus lemnae]|uniref:Peptidase A4 family protein n=2 Tax=Paenibacillus lemnae TaxID=1330551 RepID=A0A848M3C0_PAELE|nr:hypothetical protein [Paenibacillus lemnae]